MAEASSGNMSLTTLQISFRSSTSTSRVLIAALAATEADLLWFRAATKPISGLMIPRSTWV
eukprot:CAMPEP_0184321502 /NCGR_PEP_ID=MMETSP1049-20130417/119357_1 /TAXON_ID=77928 /ORGANISM="Proteomonas sulcata, Strain CCMP704" /LENGTH=60 /DNA_ID=CAMNT_0026642331 /DNA_START=330 /DNA_END=512 /DNA_ORIENTATION=-